MNIVTQLTYFLNVDGLSYVNQLSYVEILFMLNSIEKLEKQHYIIASKTRPEFVSLSDKHIVTNESSQEILEKIEKFKSKIKKI